MCTVPSCENLLFRIRKVISMRGRVPKDDVQGWQEQVIACYQRGKITSAEYEEAMYELGQLTPNRRFGLTGTRAF